MRKWRLHLSPLSVLLTIGIAFGAAQQFPTIPERAAKGENPIYLSVNREIVDPSLQDVVGAATTIVEGTLTLVRSYLSDDKTLIYTDYAINPSRVVFQGQNRAQSSPGAQPMLLKVWGGTLKVAGADVFAIDENPKI